MDRVLVLSPSLLVLPVNLGRYYHTLRYVRPLQVYGRLADALQTPTIDRSPAPPLRERQGAWIEAASRAPRMTGPYHFRFLNVERELSWPGGWNDGAASRLWLYNLHYFEDLLAHDAPARRDWHRALVDEWIHDNPPGEGVGWEPFPTSLRVANWIKWDIATAALGDAARHSLAVQTRYLRERIEYRLLGNHLLANAKALVFAGLYFAGDEAHDWLTTGLSILSRELPQQVLRDGGHFELSPMYHSLVLEDLLDLVNLARIYPRAWPSLFAGAPLTWKTLAATMGDWLAVMTLPDGQIALASDAAQAVAATPDALAAYAARLGLPTPSRPRAGATHLLDSGYVRLARDAAVAILDVGEIGPDYLPGHGHADVLGFELALYGERFIVDTGTSVYYGNAKQRSFERSTAAHNTIAIDGHDSSEVWGVFRVARRAHPLGLRIEEDAGRMSVSCAHDGYQRLPEPVTHRRAWTLADGSLTIDDDLQGKFGVAVSRLHLHPQVDVSRFAADKSLAMSAGQPVNYEAAAGARLEPSTYHPEFGLGIPAHRIVLETSQPGLRQRLSW